MTSITALPSDVFANISKFLDFKEVCHSEGVCKVFRDVMREPGIWIYQSQNEMFPLVNEPNRDRKDDFKVLLPITLSKRRAACLGEYVDDPVPMISKEEFDLLKGDDPFDREQKSFSPSAAGSKRTHDQAFSVKKMHETFVVVVEPQSFRRKFQISIFSSLVGNNEFKNDREDPVLKRAYDMELLHTAARKRDGVLYASWENIKNIDWKELIKKVNDKSTFESLKIFFQRLGEVDAQSYTGFIQDLSRAYSEAGNGICNGTKTGPVLEGLGNFLQKRKENGSNPEIVKAFSELWQRLNGKEYVMFSAVKLLLGLYPLDGRWNDSGIEGDPILTVPCSQKNIEVLSIHSTVPEYNNLLFPYFKRNLSNSDVANCSPSAAKVNVYFIRKKAPEQSYGLNFAGQKQLLEKHGFQFTPLRSKTLFNAVEVLNNKTCPDAKCYTRTANAVSGQDGSTLHAITGGFVPITFDGMQGRFIDGGFCFTFISTECAYPLLGAVPCLPVGIEPETTSQEPKA